MIRQRILLFVLLFIVFYASGYAIIALSAPNGYYSSIIDHHFNIIRLLKKSIIWLSSTLLNFCGFENVTTNNTIKIIKGGTVHLNTGCLGIGILSFWWAIILAFPNELKIKILFLISGSILVNIMNAVRVMVIAISINTPSKTFNKIDHHTLYNCIAYILLFLMMRYWLNASHKYYKSRRAIN